jgi:hypothetical protein
VPLAGPLCAVSPGPRLRLFRPVSRPECGFGVFASASLCIVGVCAIAPSFVSGWRAFFSVSLCHSVKVSLYVNVVKVSIYVPVYTWV